MGNIDIAGYGDDITPYSVNKTKKLIIHELEKLSTDLFKQFDGNYMKTNSDKSPHNGNEKVTPDFENKLITSEYKKELPSIVIDSKLTFEGHINNLYRKTESIT